MKRPRNVTQHPRRDTRQRNIALICATASVLVLGGCESFGPKPWDRDLMATRRMQLNAYPLETALDEHIYFSKEGSSGGRGFAGGGCGCN